MNIRIILFLTTVRCKIGIVNLILLFQSNREM